MDPRVREHAETIAEHCTDVGEGDQVAIFAPAAAEDLVVALHEAVGDRGGVPFTVFDSDRAQRAYLRAADPEDVTTPEHEHALVEAMDVYVRIGANENATETSDAPTDTRQALSAARQEILDERLSTRWCVTQYPAAGDAQLAEMSTAAYENFVWDAVSRDWEQQAAFQQQLVDLLDPAEEVRIVSGDTTDVRMSVAGNHAINDTATHNLPGGEVFTAPVPDSVEGEVLFDKPVYQGGRAVEDASLRFEGGEVVEHAAAKNEDVLTGILETDAGARRLGELGVGMNRAIDRFTYNMLFDEKMGDTVHMAVGRAYDGTVGEGNEQNESAQHVDMIVDMSEDSRIEIDGEVVQRNGTFRFEEGFEG
jgi:aminopeptidase